MSKKPKNNVLIIGGPNAGKTHFGGQLYGRLKNGEGKYKITNPPDDLSIFREVLDSLAEGKSAGRTHVSANEILDIQIEDKEENYTTISFPDYGGEQIDKIINDRKIDTEWNNYIQDSTAWLLFIRLEELKIVEDVINRGLPDLEIMKQRGGEKELNLSESAFYIELLQFFLYMKNKSTRSKITHPEILVILSCWDEVKDIEEGTTPSDLLKARLPMLHSFIESNWSDDSFSIIGLSSTGRSLSNEKEDEDYLEQGPVAFGYLVDEFGTKNDDLTQVISKVIE